MRQTKRTRILVISFLALLLVPGMVFGQGQQGIVPMEGSSEEQPLSSAEGNSSSYSGEADEAAGYRVVEEISVSGELVLEENELPKIVDKGVTYLLHVNYPYLLSLDLDIAAGDTVEVEGFKLPETFRWNDAGADEVVLRVSKAVIDGESYYLGMNIENGKLMVPENYAGMPGMAGRSGMSGMAGAAGRTVSPAMGMGARGNYWNNQAAPQSGKGAYGYAQPGRNMSTGMNPAMNHGAWGSTGNRGAAGAWGADERPYIEDCPYFQDNPRFDDDSAYGRRFDDDDDDDDDDYEHYGRRFDDDDSAYGSRRNGRK